MYTEDPERAFNQIVSQYGERLYWYIRTMGISHEDTDDLLQEVFIKVWNGLSTFRSESKLFTWVYRIATNETLNFIRSRSVRSSLSFSAIDDEALRVVDNDPYFDGDEAQRMLSRAIAKLPPKQRLVFNMRYYEDLKYEDIAKILGGTVGSLKASYHFAYEKVKSELEGQ